MKKIRIFDPSVCKADDYIHKYPELARIPVFTGLSSRALIFVWWYANPTSPLVITVVDDYTRVDEALKASGYNPGSTEKKKILSLQFDSDMAEAIEKMREFDPGLRYRGYQMIRKVFDNFEEIIDGGITKFAVVTINKDGSETSDTDFKRYVDTNTKIIETIPELIQKLEEGFGVVDADIQSDESENNALVDFYRSKE